MPITFQVMARGCVLLPASQARQHSSRVSSSARASSSSSQKTQHQWRPYLVGLAAAVTLASCHVMPPSTETSTRVTARPPPV